VLDESAFFRDEDYAVNDGELFKAVAPRILPGGQTILASTPWAEGQGLLYDLFQANFGAPRTALAAHAPTLLLRDDERTRAIVERERERDPDNAAREFDAVSCRGLRPVLRPTAIDAAIDSSLRIPLPHAPGDATTAGADFGFRSDSSALAVTRFDGELYRLADLVELRPARGRPLAPSAVVASFADTTRRYGVPAVIADRHYEEAIREHLATHGLRLTPAPMVSAQDRDVHEGARVAPRGTRRLPEHPRLVAQLKAIVSRPTPGGGLTISSPRRAGGGHGDLVSALVLALAALPGTHVPPWMRGLISADVKPLTFAA